MEPFRIAVSDEVLHDLADRLARRRPQSPPVTGGGESAATVAEIDRLVAYWADGFDWRAQERRLNDLPQFRATVDGVGLHFVHVRGTGPDPTPLLLTNGWPSSFIEYATVIPLLAAAGFSVVAPALVGYGFSDRGLDRRLTRVEIAALFDKLMTEQLGYARYVAHGDDIGGGIVNRLGIHHPGTVAAVQSANWIIPPLPADADEAEHAYVAADAEWHRSLGGYSHVQATRPHLLAEALNDSPLGLAAWILEKWLTWSDPATRGRLSDDDLLANVTLYWITQTIGSSVRLYALASPPTPTDVITVPASVLVPHEPDLPMPPDALLHRGYADLRRISHVPAGGHFLAAEAPETFVAEIEAAFADFR
ncbi:epoxide hydrolase family protein [Hamadaea tsunoensis]|uniref:epoxide hydrolase family protein n=1 Tax=Hamadaea tsunoensis TaxID=53368 RepID=UPI00041C093C|nr:epoxide hydrolase family protein [Hamadaea tsunoensis]